MKDDSGSDAVFTEQGSSASHMTAMKVLDVIARLPGCAGQASNAVSAYTQVNKDDAATLLTDSITATHMAKSWYGFDDADHFSGA